VLLVLRPLLSEWPARLEIELELALVILEWPILVLGWRVRRRPLPGRTWRTPAALPRRSGRAVVIWLGASGIFAFYVSSFGSYNKAWGSLAGVIIMLTWLWLSALALLLGAEINAEAERSRELRQGKPAELELQAPTRG
jgi:uncharacterized BrkB/YihY/UPF0761 family membrane protein